MSEIKNCASFWEQWIKEADRDLANADRRWRYHNKSFDAMGEKTVARESTTRHIPLDEIVMASLSSSFIESIENSKLYKAMIKLKPKHQQVIYLLFWQEYSQAEAAVLLHCSQANVSKLLNRAILLLLQELLK